MALAAIEAREHSVSSSISSSRSLPDRRVPLHSKQGRLPSVTGPRFCRVCVCLCNGIYRDGYFVYFSSCNGGEGVGVCNIIRPLGGGLLSL